ncbi:MAG: HAD-IA family hydrolase [Clostridiales bacterium]|nr:HAD-IA family hydrolase [Clostridiales bacterium]
MKETIQKPFKAVMFDIDACLIDSAPNLILSLDRALADTGGGRYPEADLRKMLGRPGHALGEMFDLPDWRRTLEVWSDYYAPLAALNKPFDGIERLLAAIRSAGLSLGVATLQGRELYLEHFHKYGLTPYFDLAVCADDVAHPKPAADPLLFAAERFGISPGEILFLGDAPYDMQCARAAGASGALAVWGTADRTIPADYYPETPLDVLPILGLTDE